MNKFEAQDLLDQGLRPHVNKVRLFKEIFSTANAKHLFAVTSDEERAGIVDGLFHLMNDLCVAFDRVYEAVGKDHQTGNAQEG